MNIYSLFTKVTRPPKTFALYKDHSTLDYLVKTLFSSISIYILSNNCDVCKGTLKNQKDCHYAKKDQYFRIFLCETAFK